ncbi:hypothetical protein GQ42DRAFT_4659 [Ramicandelaber brevisporus]|nr:hypothetical protein GQ42DRAFT_4659 [Ramicandelaber brevisporus]
MSADRASGRGHERYQLGELLGRGAYGSVYSATDIATGAKVAVKRISWQSDGPLAEADRLSAMNELQLLKSLAHPNIVRYLDCTSSSTSTNSSDISEVSIVMELCSGGSLYQLLMNKRRQSSTNNSHDHLLGFTEAQSAQYMRAVLNGVAYLHENGVVHRDIKCANVLVDECGVVKLVDFGISIRINNDNSNGSNNKNNNDNNNDHGSINISNKYTEERIPSVYWLAPEVIMTNSITTSSDVWSIGCLSIEMITGHPPYYEMEPNAAMFKIATNQNITLPNNICTNLREFMMSCLKFNPLLRPSAHNLIGHEWISSTLNKVRKESMLPPVTSSSSSSSSSSRPKRVPTPHNQSLQQNQIQQMAANLTKLPNLRHNASATEYSSEFNDATSQRAIPMSSRNSAASLHSWASDDEQHAADFSLDFPDDKLENIHVNNLLQVSALSGLPSNTSLGVNLSAPSRGMRVTSSSSSSSITASTITTASHSNNIIHNNTNNIIHNNSSRPRPSSLIQNSKMSPLTRIDVMNECRNSMDNLHLNQSMVSLNSSSSRHSSLSVSNKMMLSYSRDMNISNNSTNFIDDGSNNSEMGRRKSLDNYVENSDSDIDFGSDFDDVPDAALGNILESAIRTRIQSSSSSLPSALSSSTASQLSRASTNSSMGTMARSNIHARQHSLPSTPQSVNLHSISGSIRGIKSPLNEGRATLTEYSPDALDRLSGNDDSDINNLDLNLGNSVNSYYNLRDEYALSPSSSAASSSSSAAAELERMIKALPNINDESVLQIICSRGMNLVKEQPNLRRVFITLIGIPTLLNLLNRWSNPSAKCVILEFIKLVIDGHAELTNSFLFSGGMPTILEYASSSYNTNSYTANTNTNTNSNNSNELNGLSLQLCAVKFIRQLCLFNLYTLQMFIGCRGFQSLYFILTCASDMSCRAHHDLASSAVDCLNSVLNIPSNTAPRTVICQLLSTTGILDPLTAILSNLHRSWRLHSSITHNSANNSSVQSIGGLASSLSSSTPGDSIRLTSSGSLFKLISKVLHVFAHAGIEVKESLAKRSHLARILRSVRDVVDEDRLTLLQAVKNLSMMPSTHDALHRAGVFETIVHLFGTSPQSTVIGSPSHRRVSTSSDTASRTHDALLLSPESVNQLYTILFYMCAKSIDYVEITVESGLVPHIVAIVQQHGHPMRPLMLQTICRLARAGPACREHIWRHNIPSIYLQLLQDDNAVVDALDALRELLVADPQRMVPILIQTDNAHRLARVFVCTSPRYRAFEELLAPLEKLLSISPALTRTVCMATFPVQLVAQSLPVQLPGVTGAHSSGSDGDNEPSAPLSLSSASSNNLHRKALRSASLSLGPAPIADSGNGVLRTPRQSHTQSVIWQTPSRQSSYTSFVAVLLDRLDSHPKPTARRDLLRLLATSIYNQLDRDTFLSRHRIIARLEARLDVESAITVSALIRTLLDEYTDSNPSHVYQSMHTHTPTPPPSQHQQPPAPSSSLSRFRR